MKNQLENIKSWTAKHYNVFIVILLLYMFFLQVLLIVRPTTEVIKEVEKPVEIVKEKIVEVDKKQEELNELQEKYNSYKRQTIELLEIDNEAFKVASEMMGVMTDAVTQAFNKDANGMEQSTNKLKLLTKKLEDLKTKREAVMILLVQ